MISVKQAEKIIFKNLIAFSTEKRRLADSLGAVLKEDIYADRDLPPFNRVLMDGIAVNNRALKNGVIQFRIEKVQAAGAQAKALTNKNNCVEIMTGAALPKGCDSVIPVEKIHFNNGTAVLNQRMRPQRMKNVKRQASDHKKGDRLVAKGSVLLPQHIAVAASVGKSALKVSKRPRIAIISTGDELVDVDAPIKPFQIRKSNSYALKAIFELSGFLESKMFHVRDNKRELQKQISKALNEFDVLVLSGGVSMGKYDYVPEVLKNLKVKVLFHKVKQRPGKPFWFGKSRGGKPVFALPGNPVSTQVCAYRYVLPFLKRVVGITEKSAEHALLANPVESLGNLTYFCPVKVSHNKQGQQLASPISHSGSGDFVSIAQADGFLELPADKRKYKKGESFRLYRWDLK